MFVDVKCSKSTFATNSLLKFMFQNRSQMLGPQFTVFRYSIKGMLCSFEDIEKCFAFYCHRKNSYFFSGKPLFWYVIRCDHLIVYVGMYYYKLDTLKFTSKVS